MRWIRFSSFPLKSAAALLLCAVAAGQGAMAAAEVPAPTQLTALTPEMLDQAKFAEWMDGREVPLSGDQSRKGPQAVFWTRTAQPQGLGWTFGESSRPGPRHLRIAFARPQTVGTILVRGGGRLSVAKPTAGSSPDLANEGNWIPAQRLVAGKVSTAEVRKEEYALWILPPGTSTTALRLTHMAAPADPSYAGEVGSLILLPNRWINLAPQALPSAGSGTHHVGSVVNERQEDFDTLWQRIDKNRPAPIVPAPVSDASPEWLQLTWPIPVQLDGLIGLGAGFATARVQMYGGPADRHPRDSRPEDWTDVEVYGGMQSGYPHRLWPNYLRFPKPLATRAVRLLLTQAVSETHPHLKGRSDNGRNVWLGELMAVRSLGDGTLESVKLPQAAEESHPPIPVRFTLKEGGFVTLVIEDQQGQRVRNLVSETWFEAGENVVWWDATNDLGRDADAARHGIYRIPSQFVEPGEYQVRGLVRAAVDPRYMFSIYAPGTPPWETADKTGGWLTNHSPPQAALFVPAEAGDAGNGARARGKPRVFLGSYVSEGGSGLAWVDLEGRKLGGQGWVGGVWTGAPFLARDSAAALPEVYAYVASAWGMGSGSTKAQLRLTGLTAKGEKAILRHEYETRDREKITSDLGGIAVHEGKIIVSLRGLDQLMMVNAPTGAVLGTTPLPSPRGVAFDSTGRLLVLKQSTLLRYPRATTPADLSQPPETLISGLEDAQQLTMDRQGRIYISDLGNSHQVKVFDPAGKLLRAIGAAGKPGAGLYNPLHMNHPAGLAIDAQDQLWVTENDYLPKRVSVWSLDGKLLRTWYGPGKYGGGGTLDPVDESRFYYADEGRGTLEFRLDWKTGQSELARVLYRQEGASMPLPDRAAAPELALMREGQRYFTNVYNNHPTSGSPTGMIFAERGGVLQPVAAIGRGNDWEVLKAEAFRSRWPKDVDLRKSPYLNQGRNHALFLWSDLNADAVAQAEEVQFQGCSSLGGVTLMPDLSFCIASVDGRAMRYAPTRFTEAGVPCYDLKTGSVLVEGVLPPASSGGNQVLAEGPWTVATLGLKPYSPLSVSGAYQGKAVWSYPNLWPGLHASHEAPTPDRAGELIGPTRLLGGTVSPAGSEVGPLWAINGNMGNVYLFTVDGLFVATLFADSREGRPWAMPSAQREMPLEGITLHQENFWPTISQGRDGNVYLADGNRMAMVRLDGLKTLRRIPTRPLKVSAADLQQAQTYVVQSEASRQKAQGGGILRVPLRQQAPTVDGRLEEWTGASWVDIDTRGVAAHFNSNSKPYNVAGTLAVAGDRLYVAYRTGDDQLLRNTGELPTAPFKTGGALDLMLGTNPSADDRRSAPVAGDVRLVVTRKGDKTMAVLYRAVVPGTTRPVAFSSPWRTITLDGVEDVSAEVQLAGGEGGAYEFSIPLSRLGLQPQAGQAIRGDLGILRGNGMQTTARVYWMNKATGITADVPSEAMLTPQLWGRLQFEKAQ